MTVDVAGPLPPAEHLQQALDVDRDGFEAAAYPGENEAQAMVGVFNDEVVANGDGQGLFPDGTGEGSGYDRTSAYAADQGGNIEIDAIQDPALKEFARRANVANTNGATDTVITRSEFNAALEHAQSAPAGAPAEPGVAGPLPSAGHLQQALDFDKNGLDTSTTPGLDDHAYMSSTFEIEVAANGDGSDNVLIDNIGNPYLKEFAQRANVADANGSTDGYITRGEFVRAMEAAQADAGV